MVWKARALRFDSRCADQIADQESDRNQSGRKYAIHASSNSCDRGSAAQRKDSRASDSYPESLIINPESSNSGNGFADPRRAGPRVERLIAWPVGVGVVLSLHVIPFRDSQFASGLEIMSEWYCVVNVRTPDSNDRSSRGHGDRLAVNRRMQPKARAIRSASA
jgi:hypothetical protein